MSEATVEHESTPMAAESVEHPRREGIRRRGGIFRLAAVVVTVAGIVLVIAVIFWSGFVLGVCGGGDHHDGHEGGGGGHMGEMMQDGPE